jgi:hypothetical protein
LKYLFHLVMGHNCIYIMSIYTVWKVSNR